MSTPAGNLSAGAQVEEYQRERSSEYSTRHDWASLPTDLLLTIADHLFSVVDAIRFAAVCTSWRSAAPAPLSLQQEKPYLLLRSRDDHTDCVLQDIFSGCIHRIDPLPEILQGDSWLVGSQFGWITVLDKLANPSLVNPFTRSQIQLPPLTTLWELVQPIYDPHDGSLSGYHHINFPYLKNDKDEFYDSSPEEFRIYAIQKVVLSSSPSAGDFTAVATFGYEKPHLIYVRPGGTEWNLVEGATNLFEDIIFHDGRFLALSNDRALYALDFGGPVVRWDYLAARIAPEVFFPGEPKYLVESRGVLLRVMRQRRQDRGDIQPRTVGVVVTQLDPEAGDWIPVTTLKDQSLFLGSSYSMSITAANFPGMKQNCVYFTDDEMSYDYSPYEGDEYEDEDYDDVDDDDKGVDAIKIPNIIVYSLEDNCIQTIQTPDERYNWLQHIWVTSYAT